MNERRFIAVIVSLLLLAMAAQAQTYIFGRADFPVGAAPISIASGDFNGDGVIDLAVVNEADNTVSILLGKPDATFAPQVTYATGVGPVAIVAGDFDGDGNLDLAVTNADCALTHAGVLCTGHTVSILLGNGDGSFRPQVDYSTGTYPSSVAAGDFNGDSKLDLAITNSDDSTVSVLLGNGDGTFQAQVVYPTVSDPHSVIAADFNGDSKLDLAIGGIGVSVLLGNGNGTFQASLNSPGGPPLAAADFNLDGKLDLFAGGDALLGNGDGTFVLHTTYSSGTAAAAADLNGDGKPDLVLTQSGDNNASGNSVAILLGNGDGTFQSAVQYGTGTGPFDVVVTDFNGDGKSDLVVANAGCNVFINSCSSQPGAVSVLLGFGDGTFVGGTDYPFQSASPASQLISADFNGDAKPDLAAETGFAPGVAPLSVFLGNGDGTFQPQVSTFLAQTAGGVAAGDFNGDGKADLATVYPNCSNNTCSPGDAVILIGNGDGTFQAPVQYSVGLEPEYLAVGDFNSDGKPDLAVSNFLSNTVSILLNNGVGSFRSHVDYPVGTSPGQISTGDFKGNGILDLAIVSGANITILLGNGDGTFTPGTPVAVVAQAVAVADFNGDGKLDLAAVGSQLFICLGNGDGTFQTPVSYPSGPGALPSVADFNGDGIPDLIVGAEFGPIAAILLNNGDGSFQPPILNFLSSGSIAAADFNQDGSPDVAAGTGFDFGNSNFAVAVMLSAAFKAISPASLSFGSQGVGTTSATRTITISNPSNVSFNIASIVASGNFSQTNNCGTSLAIGAQCAVTVSFTPSATGLESGAITVTDSTRISPLAIPLSGTGVNGPFLTPLPSRTNFAPQAVGTSSTPAVITLANTGNAAVNITGISVTGADSSDFAPTNNCGSSLPAGGSCTVSVTFTPAAPGSRTASIAIGDSAPGSPQLASLAGTGGGPYASLSPSSLTFSAQAVATTSTAQVVTLTNSGIAALNLTQITASGDFAETNTCNTSLPQGSTCQVSVTFTPTAIGTRSGAVTIMDNAPGSPQTIALSGAAIAVPDFSIGPASGSAVSQTISAGQSAMFSLVVTPSGSFTGTVNLSCSLSPPVSPAPTCGFSSSSVQISGSTAQLVTVTVGTTAPVTTGAVAPVDFPPGVVPMTWMATLLGSGWLLLRNRKRMPRLAAPLIVLALATWVGCGGSSSSSHSTPGTPSGTYTATIAGTSGSLNHNMTLTVVVQ